MKNSNYKISYISVFISFFLTAIFCLSSASIARAVCDTTPTVYSTATDAATYVVPTDCDTLTVKAWGAGGGGGESQCFSLPGWVIYTLIGLAVLVVGFFAFWAGRRTAYYEEPI